MKLALLLPGYLESPDYHHLVVIGEKLKSLGYTTIRVDACHLWETRNASLYTTTNYLHQVEDIIKSFQSQNPTEIILVGHSQGSFVALLAGNNNLNITKIIGLCLPNPLGQSSHKWVNGVRISQKDLPNDSTKFREFSIPISYVHDRDQYSLMNELKKITQPLLVIMGQDDPSVSEVEAVVKELNLPNFIKIKNMGHDFRQSDELCHQVANEIAIFLRS
ncbi:alpha/beta hydrolase [Candidatus Shapirobacteria bacterium]|nr:alpha/beta hydrolase [Candidatus Shapirobacteria bacterium]